MIADYGKPTSSAAKWLCHPTRRWVLIEHYKSVIMIVDYGKPTSSAAKQLCHPHSNRSQSGE